MMNGDVVCGMPMMAGMALIGALLVAALGLSAAAAVKYLRSDIAIEEHDANVAPRTGRR